MRVVLGYILFCKRKVNHLTQNVTVVCQPFTSNSVEIVSIAVSFLTVLKMVDYSKRVKLYGRNFCKKVIY